MDTEVCHCPACESSKLRDFFVIDKAPVHSILLIRDKEAALGFPTGEIRLSICETCGFVFNRSFDGSLQNYSEDCEETQSYSGTFSAFHKRLAQMVIDRFNLHGKTVLEIGCGKGEFLLMLCEMGHNDGIGFDPAYREDRLQVPEGINFKVYPEFYPESYPFERPDFIACKMTLEHIPDVLAFMRTVRAPLGDRTDIPVFFQIPEARRVFGDIAFWDVYYEHCSYFSKGSLGRLFRLAGFEVRDLWTAYDDQYLIIEAYPSVVDSSSPHPDEEPVSDMLAIIENYKAAIQGEKLRWSNWLKEGLEKGLKTVLWGGGSKAVAFLTLMDFANSIEYVVDINPHRQGTYLAGVGQRIISPEYLRGYQPDRVLIMNAIYLEEITSLLKKLGLSPELFTIDPQK